MAMGMEECAQALRTLKNDLASSDFNVIGSGFKRDENGYVLRITLSSADRKRESFLPLTHSNLLVEYTFAGLEILT